MKKKLIIIGIGETAKLAYEYFMYDSDYKPCAFAVSKKYKSMDFLYEIPVVNMEDLDQRYSMNEYEVFVAIGSGQLNTERERVYKYIKSLGFKLASYISSKSFIWQNVEIGENCFIMENVTIQPFAKLGNNIIMFPDSLVAHSSNICDNCFISSGCIVSGFCHIGFNTFLGANSTISDNVNIGNFNYIGMGSAIHRNTEDDKLYYIDKITKKSSLSATQVYITEEENEN